MTISCVNCNAEVVCDIATSSRKVLYDSSEQPYNVFEWMCKNCGTPYQKHVPDAVDLDKMPDFSVGSTPTPVSINPTPNA